MTTYVPDWDDLSKNAGTFDPIPAGKYDAVVVEAEATKSSTDKPMIKAKFKVESGPHQGRPVWNQFTISAENGNALFFFFKHMEIFGMSRDWFTQNKPTMTQVAENMVNKRCNLEVNIQGWNGQQRNNVKAVTKASGASPVTAAPAASGNVPSAAPPAAPPAPASTPAPTQTPAPQTPAPQAPATPPPSVPAPQVPTPQAPATQPTHSAQISQNLVDAKNAAREATQEAAAQAPAPPEQQIPPDQLAAFQAWQQQQAAAQQAQGAPTETSQATQAVVPDAPVATSQEGIQEPDVAPQPTAPQPENAPEQGPSF